MRVTHRPRRRRLDSRPWCTYLRVFKIFFFFPPSFQMLAHMTLSTPGPDDDDGDDDQTQKDVEFVFEPERRRVLSCRSHGGYELRAGSRIFNSRGKCKIFREITRIGIFFHFYERSSTLGTHAIWSVSTIYYLFIKPLAIYRTDKL